MTTDLDPVVALAAALLSGSESTRAGLIRSSKASSNSTSGFNSRTCAVLDALAALCVREPKSDVIAIGCRYQKPSTELIIASNDGPPPELTLKQLGSIWRLLQDISNRMLSGNEVSIDERAESPEFDISQSYGDTTFHTLFIEIFKHSFMLAQKRSRKYMPVLEAFDQQYSRWIAHKESMDCQQQALAEWKHKETFEQFRVIISALASMNQQLVALQNKAWVADSKEMEHLISTWWIIDKWGSEVLKNRVACDTWADDVKAFGNLYYYNKTLGQSTNNIGSYNQPCRLKRAIEKLCTIHFQVGTLIRFAFSRRMRFMLCERDLVITAVNLDALTNKRPMPSTETEWCKVLQGVFDRQELLFDGTPEVARANEKEIFRKALAQGSPIMHCECLLVAYLLCRGTFPSVSYIGLSKLSCKPCFLWLQAVSKYTGYQFNTKRSHDKWYSRWSAPALEGNKHKSAIDKLFLTKVESELCEELMASKVARPRAQSDSSNSSEVSKANLKVPNLGEMLRLLKSNSPFSLTKNKD